MMLSKGVNKVILLGHLRQDPEISYNRFGKIIAHFTLATEESWQDKATGQQRESTEYHRVVVLGRLAKVIKSKTKKGTQVYLEGKNKTIKRQDDNGKDYYLTEVMVGEHNGVIQIAK